MKTVPSMSLSQEGCDIIVSAAVAADFPCGRGRERGGARLGLSDERVVRATVGHPFERHQVRAGVDNADADDLFELLGLIKRRVDDNVAAFLSKFH